MQILILADIRGSTTLCLYILLQFFLLKYDWEVRLELKIFVVHNQVNKYWKYIPQIEWIEVEKSNDQIGSSITTKNFEPNPLSKKKKSPQKVGYCKYNK